MVVGKRDPLERGLRHLNLDVFHAGKSLGSESVTRLKGDEEYSNGMPLEAINPVPDALSVIAEINELGHGRVWIVSKATRRTEP